ncbi:MAG: hypothetical protein Q4G14_14110 [Paracoccus sp. (in: a-proteobacteria)]|uniref:hypothetical protein n=1 Tax=Paracoccus sp. TaxID=267 RepID=UPI0026E09023|nr:hypothetical protein [Paracoccus sp. (in: a-proteobacteria)]MDO5614361.1 hypothetical protein [Paracoccus sp. (in: a-proteobacteria)]
MKVSSAFVALTFGMMVAGCETTAEPTPSGSDLSRNLLAGELAVQTFGVCMSTAANGFAGAEAAFAQLGMTRTATGVWVSGPMGASVRASGGKRGCLVSTKGPTQAQLSSMIERRLTETFGSNWRKATDAKGNSYRIPRMNNLTVILPAPSPDGQVSLLALQE